MPAGRRVLHGLAPRCRGLSRREPAIGHLVVGAAIGLVHGLFVLVAPMPVLPAMHPRMAAEQHGPTPTKQLEPPGFLALNYGRRTPLSVVLAHLVYGGILGAFYQVT